MQYIADKKPTSWIGKTGSNIISVAQKPLKLEIAKYLKGSATTTTSAQLSTYGTPSASALGHAVKYEITLETTTATDDLTLRFGSPSGSGGEGYFAGYTVAAVPEPSSTALLGFGGLALILRRRK